ncbi:MAG: DUF6930 domain-containing protein [Longimicrobiales bacterium]
MSRRRGKLKSVKGAQGAAPADLPLSADVWEADMVPLPEAAVAGMPGAGALRVAIAAVVGSDLVVGTEIGEWSDDAETIADVVLEAMTAPMAGNPRRPAAVRVRRTDAARALADRLPKGTDVEFADTLPAIEAVARGLDEFLLGESLVSATGPDLSAMEDFFDAAAAFYEAAPWQRLGEPTPLEISVNSAPAVFGIVLGEEGEMHGLALHGSFDELLELMEGARDESNVRLIFYLPESDVPPTIAEQRKLRRWRVAGPAAFPVLVRRRADGSEPNPDVEDLRLAAAALRATRSLHTDATVAELAEPGEMNFVVGNIEGASSAVRVAWPAGGGLERGGKSRRRRARASARRRRTGADAIEPLARTGPDEEDVGEGERFPELEELVQRITRLPSTRRVLPRLAWTFFRALEPRHVAVEDMEDAMARFSEWAMFSALPSPDRPTLAAQAVARAARQLDKQRVAALRVVARPRHSLYRVTAVDDDAITVRDVLRKTRMRVLIRDARRGYSKGIQFIGNLFPAPNGAFRLGSTLTEVEGKIPAESVAPPPEVAAVMAEADVFGATAEWILELDSIAELRDAWSDFRRALGNAGTRLPSFGSLQKRIRTAKEPQEVVGALARRSWWSFEEMEVCTTFVHQAWNLTPRDELDGRSPLRAFEEDHEE